MKILFTRFPLESAIKGGAEVQTISLMLGLIERGHTVVFAGSCPALLSLCKEHHIPTIEWEIGPPPVTKWHAISFFWRKQHMRTSLQQLIDTFFQQEGGKLDAVVMLSLSAKLLLTDIAVDSGARVYWIEHDRVGNWLRNNPWLSLLLKQSRLATTIVVSELSHRIYRELGWHEKNLITIPNGVDFTRLSAAKDAEHVHHATLRLGCIARLSPEKGVDLLIQAIAPLAGLHLDIVGEGKDETMLKALVKASNITDMVTFTPFEERVSDVYQRIDVLVLPSRDHDPFGLVAAEAMMLGIPVILTDQCGISGYLTNGKDAMIVQANSVSALQQAIQWMQNTAHRQTMSEHARKTAHETFALSTMIEQYEKVLKNTQIPLAKNRDPL